MLTCDATKDGFDPRPVLADAPPLSLATQKLDFPVCGKQGQPVFFTSLISADRHRAGGKISAEGFDLFAAFPLFLEDRLVGCLTLYSGGKFSADLVVRTRPVSNGIALCIQSKQAEAQVEKLAAFPRVNPNPILELTAEADIGYANDAALEPTRCLGKKHLLEILPASLRTIVSECFASGVKRLGEQVVIAQRTISWSFFPVPGSNVVHCYGAEITEMLNRRRSIATRRNWNRSGRWPPVSRTIITTSSRSFRDTLISAAKTNAADPQTNPLKQIAGAYAARPRSRENC